jgi:hypothetical protein
VIGAGAGQSINSIFPQRSTIDVASVPTYRCSVPFARPPGVPTEPDDPDDPDKPDKPDHQARWRLIEG